MYTRFNFVASTAEANFLREELILDKAPYHVQFNFQLLKRVQSEITLKYGKQ